MNDPFVAMCIYKGECLQEVEGRDSSAASFIASVEERISEKECKLYDEGLNSKVKLALYRTFSKEVGFKKYLHDVNNRLLLFMSGTRGLN